MRVLVTGREGQVVRALLERGADVAGLELIAVGRPELDLGRPGSAAEAVRRAAPDMVISAAAYTNVDQAEDEPELANRVNGDAPGELAAAARELGARIVHLSTDYVFDGTSPEPYREDAPTNPVGAYGKSKLQGEERVGEESSDALIIRTAWVYGPIGRNFVRTMLAAAQQRDELTVVDDQIGNPTSALDIADALLSVVTAREARAGIYHFAGADAMSWAGFAERIFQASRDLGGPTARVKPISSADWPVKAARPANSRLDSSAFAAHFGFPPQPVTTSLTPVVARILGDQAA